MKKSTYLISTVLLFLFGLMACQQQPKSIAPTAEALARMDILDILQIVCNKMDSLHGKTERGIELPFALAKICFEEYDTIMSEHCFLRDSKTVKNETSLMTTSDGIKRRQIDSFRLVTRSESFLGMDVLCWLIKQSKLAADTSKFVTELRMGIYTQAFFDSAAARKIEIPDSIREQRLGRMAIFLVPYEKVEEKAGLVRVDPPVVYDFGSLQP